MCVMAARIAVKGRAMHIMDDEDRGTRRLEIFQKCPADRKVFSFNIQSASDPNSTYEIKGSFVQGEISCDCPGFKFRDTCKHLRLEVEECGWNALESSEPQTMLQKEDRVCPRCGGPTVDSGRGGF